MRNAKWMDAIETLLFAEYGMVDEKSEYILAHNGSSTISVFTKDLMLMDTFSYDPEADYEGWEGMTREQREDVMKEHFKEAANEIRRQKSHSLKDYEVQ